jgi:hypothetical protein
MRTDEFGTGSGEAATPYSGLQNLPAFLVGVPMTKGINRRDYSVTFDAGGIHAYGFRQAGWENSEPGVTTVFGGSPKYDASGDSRVDTVVYKYFPSASFRISTRSYMWFFTRTPESEGVAALNSIPVPRSGNLVASRANMSIGVFDTGSGDSATPFRGMKNLPGFLVGVPMTKGINVRDNPVKFDSGGIHAYGFRQTGWTSSEPDVKTVLSNDTRYAAEVGGRLDTVVYKFFPDAEFSVSTESYIWFFTRTPEAEGTAALNSTSAPAFSPPPVLATPAPPLPPVYNTFIE